MKKYGLNLRIPPGQQQKQKQKSTTASKPPPAFAFKDDDDEDDVEREISRQAVKARALQKVEEQHKKALEEDPSVFDYDGVYDEMKDKIARPRVQDKTERKSKYIETLMQKAKEREREHEIIYEKKILKERSKEDHLFADKEKFVTSAYRKQLAERAKWLEEERLRQLREEQDDVTKKKDLSEFYFSLEKNIAFGAQSKSSMKPSKKEGEAAEDTQENTIRSNAESTVPPAQEGDKSHVQSETHRPSETQVGSSASSALEVASEVASPRERNTTEEAPPPPPAQTAEYKRSEDALSAARERYLARKRTKEQADQTAASEQQERSDDAFAIAKQLLLARKKSKGQ